MEDITQFLKKRVDKKQYLLYKYRPHEYQKK